MTEPFFSGDQETKLDAKGRTSIPAAFRSQLKALGQTSFYAYPSRHQTGALECSDINQMNRMKSAMSQLSPMDPMRRELELSIFSQAHEIVFDGDGRTVIPKALRNAAGLEGLIYFKGRAETFEIWNAKVFEENQNQPVALTDDQLAAFNDAWAKTAQAGETHR